VTRRRLALRVLVGTCAALALVALTAREAWRLSGSRSRQLVGELVTRAQTADSIVALTFDDGPVPVYTDSVLDALRALDVPATFFRVGRSIERNPGIADRVVAAGHELGNHSYSHRRMLLKTPGTIRRYIERTDSLIAGAGQTGIPWMRPPYGKRLFGLPWYLSRSDRPVVLWSLEPDTYHTDADGMVRYVTEGVEPGAIILLHVEIAGRREGRAALPRIVSELRGRGYRFVTLTELLSPAHVASPAAAPY